MDRARVEVFSGADDSYCLVVEPRSAIEGVRRHLAAQSEGVEIVASSVVGDIGVNLSNGQSIEAILSGVAIVVPVNGKK